MASSDRGDARADVELRLPARRAWASVLRTTAAALVARLDFTIDEIEDVRIAVGEATALVLAAAEPDADLVARFDLGEGEVAIALSTEASAEPDPTAGDFAWQLLTALSPDARTDAEAGHFDVHFSMTSQNGRPG